MKTELPCAVVRDLLPSYVEGLTEEETTSAVRDHLETCESCRTHYEAMAGDNAAPAAESKEVDYLKTVRKKNRTKIILAAVLAVVLVLGGVGGKLCIIGSPADADSIAVHVTPESGYATVNLYNMDSASALINVKTQTENGIVNITARKALVSPFHRSGDHSLSVNIDGIKEIRAFGKTIWQDGTIIDAMTHRLIDRKTAYTGDAPAIGMILSGMNLDSPATLELQTEKEPYGVTVHFTDVIAENRRFLVEGNAYVLLALVENLGQVQWDDPSGYTDSVTLEEANAALPGLVESYNRSHGTDLVPLAGVKEYSADSCQLQILRNILGL